jgi:penicillin-binding protein 2
MNRRRGANIDLRIHFFGIVILGAFAALVARLWWLQVARGSEYTAKIRNRTQVTVRIPSVRGEIRDRNGLPLVQNRASYAVDFYLPDMVRGFRQRARETNQPVPMRSYRATVKSMLKDLEEPDIIRIVNTAVIPRLEDLDLAQDYNSKRLQSHYHVNAEVPFTYLEDIDFATIAKFSEHDVGLPGVNISIKPVRQYLFGALAAHLLGYVGMPRDLNLQPDIGNYDFYQADFEGKSNIELYMDRYLRGTPGVRVMQRNVKGQIDSELRVEPPKPGNNVYLTLDARIQYAAEEALRYPAIGRAAAVVVDPNNGDILAMASVPSFDPNVFIPSISSEDWKALNNDPSVPLVNRAVSGLPPGSTFKIVTALAGLKKNLGGAHYICTGGVQYGNTLMHCWIAEKNGQHGMVGLSEAIKVSCDSFFYQYGNAAGIDAIDQIGGILGLGQKFDIGLLDEKEGSLPGPDWMRVRYPNEHWSQGQTANTSIGQGYVLASPLQMAMAYATVANGGIAYAPRLVDQVLTPEGRPLLDEAGNPVWPRLPRMRADLRSALSPQQIEVVRQGLWKVVNEEGGTGAKARLKGTIVAGKTGTAQASERGKRETIAWFCCFAPYDNPKYVVAVMVQGGLHGGSVAGPVAAKILEQCLAIDQGKFTGQIAALEPARSSHPFEPIAALDYKNEGAALASDEETANLENPSEKAQMEAAKAEPDIKPAADAQGRVIPRAERVEPGKQPDRRNIFEKFFHPGKPAGGDAAPEKRRSRWPF